MSKGLQWILGISAVLIALAIVASRVLPFFFPQAGIGGWPSMMGPNHMFGGGPMTPALAPGASVGGLGAMSFFGLGMLLVPLLFIGLLVLGVVWLVRSVAPPAAPQPPAASAFCANCGKPVLATPFIRPFFRQHRARWRPNDNRGAARSTPETPILSLPSPHQAATPLVLVSVVRSPGAAAPG